MLLKQSEETIKQFEKNPYEVSHALTNVVDHVQWYVGFKPLSRLYLALMAEQMTQNWRLPMNVTSFQDDWGLSQSSHK